MMKAAIVTAFGEPGVIQLREVSRPRIECPRQVLVKVHAAGVNRPDVFQRRGKYPAPVGVVQNILGLEVAGEIVDVGDEVHEFTIGARVMALLPGGGYAEFVSVDAGSCIAVPENLSFAQAGALPETLFTVWNNVFQRGQLRAGNSLLVHGGSGGIGSMAIQLAKLFGAAVYTTVGSQEKMDYALNLGAAGAINYHLDDFESAWSSVGFDVILDSIGGAYFEKNINLLKPDGRLVYINAMGGAKVELNLIRLMQKRIILTGSTLRNRDVGFKADIALEIKRKVLPLIIQGMLKIPIAQIYSLKDAGKAHQLMESGSFMGKIVLSVV